MNLKSYIKEIAYRFGLDVRRARPRPKSGGSPSTVDPFHEQRRLLANESAPLIFDVGAHIGQTAAIYKKLFPKSTIYSFEPFSDSFQQLVANTHALRDVHPVSLALARSPGELRMTVNRSTATNSLLPTDARASDSWNGTDVTDTVGETTVRVSTVDEFLAQRNIAGEIDILKMDAQGSELDILAGAERALADRRLKLVYSEIIVMPTYVGQRHLDEFLLHMRERDYVLHNFYNQCFTNDGRVNQLDALFLRSDLADGR